MHLHALIDHYAAYDLWANSLFVKRLDREPTEVLDHEVPSSFPTLRTTLLHIRDAEHVWLCRLNNVAHSWPAEASIEPGSLLKHNVLLRDKVAQMSETMLEKNIAYPDLRGNNRQSAAWHMLMHCFNHSSYHRGQLVSMMHALNMDEIPTSDLIVYFRSIKTS